MIFHIFICTKSVLHRFSYRLTKPSLLAEVWSPSWAFPSSPPRARPLDHPEHPVLVKTNQDVPFWWIQINTSRFGEDKSRHPVLVKTNQDIPFCWRQIKTSRFGEDKKNLSLYVMTYMALSQVCITIYSVILRYNYQLTEQNQLYQAR